MSLTTPSLWHQAPFIRLLLPLVIGITSCYYFFNGVYLFSNSCVYRLVYGIVGTAIVGLLLLSLFSKAKKYQFRLVQGLTIQLVFVAGGMTVMQRTLDARRQETQLLAAQKSNAVYVLRLLEPLVLKNKTYKTVAVLERIGTVTKEIPSQIKIILYLQKKSANKKLPVAGSLLATRKKPSLVPDTHNPQSFHYKEWLFRNEITHQLFLVPGNWVALPQEPSKQYLTVIQQRIRIHLQQNIAGKEEKAVAAALLIGYKQDVDSNLMKAYSNTGVIHVIAISGLHLGLIYGLLLGLFTLIPNKKIRNWIAPPIMLLVLWGFALLTGAGPSIVRAAVMFSFIIVASIVKQQSNIINALAASAFFLVLLHPFYLWDIGFQLSYAAVLSIVLYRKNIYDFIYFKYSWLQACWQLNAVTLSAQILTLPLVIYHFHQFPNYFLLSNFIVVPLSSIILYGCLLLFPFSNIMYLGKTLSVATSWLITIMNWIIQKMNTLPFATTSNLQISSTEVYLFFIVIAFFTLFLQTKKNKWCYYSLITLLMSCSVHSLNQMAAARQTTLTVWFVPKISQITTCYGLERERALQMSTSAFTIGHTRFLRIGQMFGVKNGFRQTLNVDILLIGDLPKSPIPLLAKRFKRALYVFDSSIPLWKMEQWKKELEDLHLRHHFVSQQGAFVHQSSNGKEN